MGRATCLLLALLLCQTSTSNASEERHGLSFFGDLKYPADFTSFEYVNPQAPKVGSLRMPSLGNFDTLNPFIRKGRKPSGMNYDGRALIYDRLMSSSDDEASSQYGKLAESVELADDFSWVTFRIRRQARWHDGKPVTVNDVLFTFNQIKEHGSPTIRARLRDVLSGEVLDSDRIKFRFRNSTSPKLAQTIAAMYVVPAHYWRDRDFSQTTLEIPLGSGPYRISEVKPGRKIVYERVVDYWGKDIPVNKGRFNFDQVIIDFFSDEHVIHEALKAGVLDARSEGVAKRWATEYDFPGYRNGFFIKNLIKTERPQGMVFGIVFNLRMKKFQDIRVREALALAYDFEWSNRVLYHDFYKRTDSFFENSDLAQRGLPSDDELDVLEAHRGQVPPRVFTHEYRPAVTKGYGYARDNLLKAARLFKQAGYVVRDGILVNGETGEPFTIDFVTVSVYLERTLLPYVNALQRLGIDSRIRTVEVSQFINRLGRFDFEGTIRSYGQTLTPGIELRSYWGSRSADQNYSRNTGGIKDQVVDDLIEEIIGARSRRQLIAAARALDRVMLWNFYIIPGYFPPGYRYGYWDKFGRPAVQALYRSGFYDTWWYDEERAARTASGMGKMIQAGTSSR